MRNSAHVDRRPPRGTPAWSPLLLLGGSVAAAVLLIGTGLSVVEDVAEPSVGTPVNAAGKRASTGPAPLAPQAIQVAGVTPMH